MRLFFILYLCILLRPCTVFANSSFDELVKEVAVESGISRSLASEVVRSTFGIITRRMLDDKGTSIPDFGRFYVQEKQKASGKDKDGFTLAPRMVRTPRCTMSKELRTILEK
jgi:nucleoid DNA-binding protein